MALLRCDNYWINPELAKTRFLYSLGAEVKEETKILKPYLVPQENLNQIH